jgi:hypothetical protein
MNQPEMEQPETDPYLIQPFDATIRLTPPEYLLLINGAENRELFRILPNGDVEAENLENASEAGRVFIESMRINGKPLLERIHELETENEKLKSELYEMREGSKIF